MAQKNYYDWLLRCNGAHLDALIAKLKIEPAFQPPSSDPIASRARVLWETIQLRNEKGLAELEKALNQIGVPPPEPRAQPKAEDEGEPRTIRIFLASSEELRKDRDEFDLYFRQQNDRLRKKGLYLEINRWENFLDAMSKTRLQDKYNKAVRNCDIFVSLFFTKTGKYTEEEFDVARGHFEKTNKPYIYTFFKNGEIKNGSATKRELASLDAFKKKLAKLGHFYTQYNSIEDLKLKFRDQLDKLYG